MCNDYEQHVAWKAYCEAMQALALDVPAEQTDLDLPLADHVRITDTAPIMRAAAAPNTVELAPMRWSGAAPNGAAVFNFRSDGRRFADSRRCLIPASAFFEFTGAKSPKTRHRFTLESAPFLCVAGLWRPGDGNDHDRFTMLTTEPGPDVAPFHKRQIVVLRPEDWRSWLYLDRPESELLRPLPAGSLRHEVA